MECDLSKCKFVDDLERELKTAKARAQELLDVLHGYVDLHATGNPFEAYEYISDSCYKLRILSTARARLHHEHAAITGRKELSV